jgi:oligopeptide/dipeptide ABC transporter ATP-binding protein
MEMELIKIENLKTYFYQGKGILSKLFGKGLRIVHAVDGVSLNIKKGHTFGLVGESGCGKSTIANTIFRLVEAQQGSIYFQGNDILRAGQEITRRFRQKAQIIFQDPYSCLNPRMTAGEIIAEPLKAYKSKTNTKSEIKENVHRLLKDVSLPADALVKFPNEFSGGQARRIGVARAIALKPEFIVADEPTSGLDISTAATILNLMQDLQVEYGLTYLWISHNLNVIKYMSDDMAIMYLGKIVEIGPTKEILQNIVHPYTKALLSVAPRVSAGQKKKKIILKGEIPSPINPPSGCRFRSRCPYAMKKCELEEPPLISICDDHLAACHLVAL